jgi:hypothetical protein
MPRQAPKPWRDWRENARELAIVVIGVLIALFAQEVVQDWEWKQKVAALLLMQLSHINWNQGSCRTVARPTCTASIFSIVRAGFSSSNCSMLTATHKRSPPLRRAIPERFARYGTTAAW